MGVSVRKCHLEDLVLNGSIVLKWILKREEGALFGLLWNRTVTGGGALVNVAMNVRRHKMRRII